VCNLETSRMGAPYIYIYIYIYDISRLRVNVHCAGMISMAKGAIRVAKSGDMTDRNEIACVLKWCAPVLKTRHPCSEKLCGKNRLLDSQESVEL